MAVVEPQPVSENGEFGWGLPQGDHPVSLRALPGLLRQVGIHWAKFPVWYDDGNADRLIDRFDQIEIRTPYS